MSAGIALPPDDAALPYLRPALDRRTVARAIAEARRFAGARVSVAAARLVRHKVGRRCLVEYDLDVAWPGGVREACTVIGKMRAGHQPGAAARRLKAFWRAGFSAASPDGICVPEPLGTVPALGLWLQRKVAGVPATAVLPTPDGPALAGRIVEAARKIHGAGVPTRRVHSVARELEILAQVLAQVSDRDGWSRRIGALLVRCGAAAAAVQGRTAAIHRDFYADQVIVDGPRLWLLDFDLYCDGPEGVDLGNFLGHVAEQAVREPAHAGQLALVESALEGAVRQHEGEEALRDVRVFAHLTLARHAYLSTVIPGREPFADRVLDAALARLEGHHDVAA